MKKSKLTVLKDKCPDCQFGYQIERVNSKTGYTFIGCDKFPKCKFGKLGGSKPAPVRKSYDPSDYLDSYDSYGEYGNYDDWGYGSQEDFF